MHRCQIFALLATASAFAPPKSSKGAVAVEQLKLMGILATCCAVLYLGVLLLPALLSGARRFFGAYVTISDCEPVAFKGDTYWNAPELAKAVGAAHGPDTMQVGFWKKHGRIPLGLVILALVGFGIWGQIGGKDDDDEDEQPEAAA